MDKGSYHRRALTLLGELNDTEGTECAALCDEYGSHAVSLCLDFFAWSWASRRASLSFTAGVAHLPADCQRLQYCSLKRFRRFGQELRAGDEEDERRGSTEGAKTCIITYVSSHFADTETLPDNEPQFCEACACMLAHLVALRLTSSAQLTEKLRVDAYQYLTAARLKDAQSIASNDQQARTELLD